MEKVPSKYRTVLEYFITMRAREVYFFNADISNRLIEFMIAASFNINGLFLDFASGTEVCIFMLLKKNVLPE